MNTSGGKDSYLEREVRMMRLRDILVFVPVFGFFIFVSPLIDASASSTTFFQIPFKFILIFALWGLGIFMIFVTNLALRKILQEREP